MHQKRLSLPLFKHLKPLIAISALPLHLTFLTWNHHLLMLSRGPGIEIFWSKICAFFRKRCFSPYSSRLQNLIYDIKKLKVILQKITRQNMTRHSRLSSERHPKTINFSLPLMTSGSCRPTPLASISIICTLPKKGEAPLLTRAMPLHFLGWNLQRFYCPNSCLRKRAVIESGDSATCSGVPCATTWPPLRPPSGPMSMM